MVQTLVPPRKPSQEPEHHVKSFADGEDWASPEEQVRGGGGAKLIVDV